MISSDLLAHLAIFEDVPPDILSELAECALEQRFERNQIIVRQHDDAHAVYLLLAGRVQFLIHFQGVDDMLVGTTDEYGAPIGWSIAREPHRYTASVRCEEPCRALRIPRAALDQVIEHNPQVGYLILCRLATAVAIRLEQARDLLITPRGMAAEGPP